MRSVLIVLVVVLSTACAPPAGPSATLRGLALAGPTCPVVTDPPDPACDDRPVAGAEIVVRDAEGNEVARVTTGDDGRFAAVLAPGRYEVIPQAVEGLMGTAAPIEVELAEGENAPITVSYDTGIR
jgi:carboxypeptidase family protein